MKLVQYKIIKKENYQNKKQKLFLKKDSKIRRLSDVFLIIKMSIKIELPLILTGR
jgi:hypothetical protein